ncbi:glutathione S-transferase [Lanmaoa asiatica]|nr:glutathione S-transferase [Lanmaoa asiatica]
MADTGKHYHDHCTGEALQTVQRHAADEDIILFAGCFCPFVQRAWVALEHLGIPYRYYEVDPYKKPKELLDLSPRGLVPALRLNNYGPPRALNESTVIMDFLEKFVSITLFFYLEVMFTLTHVPLSPSLASTSTKRSLFPPTSDPCPYHTISMPSVPIALTITLDARALVLLQSDHINRTIVPAFYRYLQAQDPVAQIASGNEFRATIDTLVGLFERADEEVGGTGLWKEGGELGWADVMVGPWMFRANNVLKHYRGFEMPEGARFNAWLKRLLEHPSFKGTCSTDELYFDSYERRAPRGSSTEHQPSRECDQYREGLALILDPGE